MFTPNGSIKRAVSAALPALALACTVAAYFWYSNRTVEGYSRQRNGQSLAILADQIKAKLDLLTRIASSASTGDERDRISRGRLGVAYSGPAAGGQPTTKGRRWMELTARFRGESHLFLIDLDTALRSLIEKEDFESTIVAKPDGTVLFENSKGALSIPNLNFLLTKSASGEKSAHSAQIGEPASGRVRLVADGPEYDVFTRYISLDPQHVQLPLNEVVVCGLTKVQGISRAGVAEFIASNMLPLLLLAALLCMSRPVQRVWSVNRIQRLQMTSTMVSTFISLFGVALLVIVMLAWHHQNLFFEHTDAQLVRFGESISREFQKEIQAAIASLSDTQHAAELGEDFAAVARSGRSEATGRTVDGITRIVRMQNRQVTSFTWLDEEGWIRVRWRALRDGEAPPKKSVDITPMSSRSDRAYWTAIRSEAPKPSLKDRPYAIESVRSLYSGRNETVVAMNLSKEEEAAVPVSAGAPLVVASVITFQPRSVMQPVLPPGYGFAVLEGSGRVIYHDNDAHVLAENFISESDETLPRELLNDRTPPGLLTLEYDGRPHRALVRPIGIDNVPWTVVVYRDLTGPNLTRFLVVLATVAFVGAALLLTSVITVLLYRARARLYTEPPWAHWGPSFAVLMTLLVLEVALSSWLWQTSDYRVALLSTLLLPATGVIFTAIFLNARGPARRWSHAESRYSRYSRPMPVLVGVLLIFIIAVVPAMMTYRYVAMQDFEHTISTEVKMAYSNVSRPSAALVHLSALFEGVRVLQWPADRNSSRAPEAEVESDDGSSRWQQFRNWTGHMLQGGGRHYDDNLNPIRAEEHISNTGWTLSSLVDGNEYRIVNRGGSAPLRVAYIKPSRQISWSWPLAAGLACLCAAIALLLRFLIARLCFLAPRQPVRTADIGILQTSEFKCNHIYVGQPLSGKSALLANRDDIVLIDLATLPPGALTAMEARLAREHWKGPLVFDHFEHQLENRQHVMERVRVLEQMVHHCVCVVLISNVDPQLFLKDGGTGFVNPENGGKLRPEESFRLMGVLALFDKTWLNQGPERLRDETSDNLNHATWNACSRREKLVLIDLSEDGMVHPSSSDVVGRLLARGLLIRDPYLKFKDPEFQRFVTELDSDDLVKAWERDEQAGMPNVGRLMVIVAATVVAVVVLVTSHDIATSALSVVPAFVAGVQGLAERLMADARTGRAASDVREA